MMRFSLFVHADLLLFAKSFGPWTQQCAPFTQERLRTATRLMSTFEDASDLEALQLQLQAAQSEIESKQSVIDTLKESKEKLMNLKQSTLETQESGIKFWKKQIQEQDITITNLSMRYTMLMSFSYAIEDTRVIIEHAAIKSMACDTVSEATTALSKYLFMDENLNSNELSVKGKEWLADLVRPEPLTAKLEEEVSTALRKKTYITLSTQANFIHGIENCIYVGVGTKPDRYSQALLVLQAQSSLGKLGKLIDFKASEVVLLNNEKEPIIALMRGKVCPYADAVFKDR